MALLKALCWALIFIMRIRFPPGTSLATELNDFFSKNVRPTLALANFSPIHGFTVINGVNARNLKT